MEAQQVVPLKPQPQFVRLCDIVASLFPSLAKQSPRLIFGRVPGTPVRKELFVVVKNMLFNNDKKMVERLAKEHFVDEMHATYFMEYVYRFRRAISRLIFAPHYLGIILHATRENRWGREVDRIRRYYVIGINDNADGLFVNEMATRPPISFDVVTYNGITISTSTDEDFRSYFGYDKDVLEQEAILTLEDKNSSIRYRVSGEIIFELRDGDDDHLRSLFDEQVQRYIAYLMADKVMRILIDHGFNPILNVRFEERQVPIRLRGALSGKLATWKMDESDKERVIETFASMIEKYFTIQDMESGKQSITISDETAMVDVDFVFNLRDFRQIRGDLELWISPSGLDIDSPTKRTYDNMMHDIINSIRDMLNNSERVDELIIGNHYIRIERGLPVNFVYEPKVRPKLLDPLLITVYRPRTFLVTPRTKVTVEHTQHGTKRISFDGTYALEVTTTNISDEYLEKVNAITLRKLLKQTEQ
jgi:hypothetical protein